MPQNVFISRAAELYDATELLNTRPAAVEPAVSFLAELAVDGPALEFAIGTGRIALPLRKRGAAVHGIEISADMIAQLKLKPGGEAIPVVIGDMATSHAPGIGEFSLVYLVYNTISNLLEQPEQVACFANAAAHLRPGGAFVIELEIPQVRRMAPGQSSFAHDISPHHLGFDTYDFANQRLVSHHYWPQPAGQMTTFESQHRYAWPAELDLMAQLAGLRLRERWGDWSRAQFTGESTGHVSVWEKPTEPGR
ncbi:MAG: class I SAM-dependent methyltransferase [Ilumatobacteraceae bacterium]